MFAPEFDILSSLLLQQRVNETSTPLWGDLVSLYNTRISLRCPNGPVNSADPPPRLSNLVRPSLPDSSVCAYKDKCSLLSIDRRVYSKSTKMGLYTLFAVPFTAFRVGEVIRVAPKARG